MASTPEEKAAAKAAKDAEKAAAKAATSDSVTVTWNGGSRVYSKEQHGENFGDLAQEFATKRNGTIA